MLGISCLTDLAVEWEKLYVQDSLVDEGNKLTAGWEWGKLVSDIRDFNDPGV